MSETDDMQCGPILLLSHPGIDSQKLLHHLEEVQTHNLVEDGDEMVLYLAQTWHATTKARKKAKGATNMTHAFYGAKAITADRMATELGAVLESFLMSRRHIPNGRWTYLCQHVFEDKDQLSTFISFLNAAWPKLQIVSVEEDGEAAESRCAERLGWDREQVVTMLRRRARHLAELETHFSGRLRQVTLGKRNAANIAESP